MSKEINVFEFEYEYFHEAPSGGGTSKMNFETPNQGDFTNYILEKNYDDSGNPIKQATLSIYESGLVVYFEQLPNIITMKTNREFNLLDNGNFRLVSE